MKIYIIQEYDTADYTSFVLGVYDSLEVANAEMKRLTDHDDTGTFGYRIATRELNSHFDNTEIT